MNVQQGISRSLLESIGTALRAQSIFVLDLIVNGAFIVLAINSGAAVLSPDHNGDSSKIDDRQDAGGKRTIYDVLFALERQNVTGLWNELTWSSYGVLSFYYFMSLLSCMVAFCVDTRVLLSWIGYVGPLILSLATLIFSLEDSSNVSTSYRVLHVDDDNRISTIDGKMVLTYLYRLFVRGIYGYGVSRFYLFWRWPIFIDGGGGGRGTAAADGQHDAGGANPIRSITRTRTFSALLLRAPFFVPLISTLLAVRIPSSAVIAVFIPLLGSEFYFLLIFIIRLIVPYYFVIRLIAGRIIARPDIMRAQTFIVTQWVRLRVPLVLRSFFFARLGIQLVYVFYVALVLGQENDPYGVFAKRRLTTDWLWTGGAITSRDNSDSSSAAPQDEVVKSDNNNNDYPEMIVSALEYLLARSCETIPAIMAVSSVTSVCGRWCGYFFRWVLTGERRRGRNNRNNGEQDDNDDDDDDEDGHEGVGTLTGLLFFVLCLQTGLTSLPAEKRLWKLYRNLWLLFMAILHFVHHTVSSTMTRLCTHGRFGWTKHARVVGLGVFILIGPSIFFKFCWRYNHWLNPWLISVALFAVELTTKTLVSFVTYGLLLLDVLYPRMRVDEPLAAVKITGAVLDFFFGVCLLFNGIWILFYEQGGFLRTIMITIHGYFNIYQRAKKGLAQLRRRRLANQKMSTLRTASAGRLRAVGDEVCAICYVELNTTGNDDETTATDSSSAAGLDDSSSGGGGGGGGSDVKITACGHLLHASCLMKWLYIRDTCPLCHQTVFNDESLANNETTNDDEDDAAADDLPDE